MGSCSVLIIFSKIIDTVMFYGAPRIDIIWMTSFYFVALPHCTSSSLTLLMAPNLMARVGFLECFVSELRSAWSEEFQAVSSTGTLKTADIPGIPPTEYLPRKLRLPSLYGLHTGHTIPLTTGSSMFGEMIIAGGRIFNNIFRENSSIVFMPMSFVFMHAHKSFNYRKRDDSLSITCRRVFRSSHPR